MIARDESDLVWGKVVVCLGPPDVADLLRNQVERISTHVQAYSGYDSLLVIADVIIAPFALTGASPLRYDRPVLWLCTGKLAPEVRGHVNTLAVANSLGDLLSVLAEFVQRLDFADRRLAKLVRK